MSNILSGFSKETPQSLLALGHQTKIFPVDVAEICYKANVRLLPFDFNNLARYSPFKGDLKTIRGAIVVSDEQAAILYRTDSTILGRRFAIAHLIGHLCLHTEKEKPVGNEVWIHLDFSAEKPTEKNTNRFVCPQNSDPVRYVEACDSKHNQGIFHDSVRAFRALYI